MMLTYDKQYDDLKEILMLNENEKNIQTFDPFADFTWNRFTCFDFIAC